ncbi:unnamed protein product [Linum tenue]|uniref:Uncharacterized protein n=1 Tax=Linum tenue TaxID=586396 RepID=A0AAV0K8N6_9ROSI|nr:unnamed protein product [Linum tenue]
MVLLPGKPEVFSTEMVRPSIPTPDSHRIHRLSFFDQFSPPLYVPLLYFYLNHHHQPNHVDTSLADLVDDRTRVLKRSLSEALSTYYPLAGRMGDDEDDPLTFHCNDEGVVFLQARMNSKLSTVLSHPDGDQRDEALNLLFPDGFSDKFTSLSSPLLVQVTSFECGGMALSICASHKILDMASFSAFVNYWASTASSTSSPSSTKNHPDFNLATLFPPVDLPPATTTIIEPLPKVKSICKRFVFGPSDIAKLKALAEKNNVKNPTRVELVLALICSCAISASKACRSGKWTYKLSQAVNLRTRLSTLPVAGSDLSLGNLSSAFAMKVAGETDETDLHLFVDMIRRAKTEYFSACTAGTGGGCDQFRCFIEETRKGLKAEEAEKVYVSSSWCRFQLYEADFGWGKPVWVTCGIREPKIVLLDTREGGGIEALVCLEEGEMAVFQHDQMLLDFVRVSPACC